MILQTDPLLLSQAMEWCEHRSPDGKPYYFNVKTSSSVWEKPQALKDYDGVYSIKIFFYWRTQILNNCVANS